MRKIILVFFFVTSVLNAQEFEGIVRYGITYEIKDTSAKSSIKLEKHKKNDSILVAYIKGQDFLKYNSKPKTIDIYDSKSKLVYTIEEKDKYIVTYKPY